MKKNAKIRIITAIIITTGIALILSAVFSCTALIQSSNKHIVSATTSAISYYSHQINAKLEIEKQKIHDLGEAVRYEKYDTEKRDGMYNFLLDCTGYMHEMFAVYVGCPDNYSCFSDGWVPGDDYIVAEREWYKLAITSDSPVITEPYIDALTGKMVVTIAYAVHNENNEISSVVAADMFINDIQDIVSGFSYMKSGYPVLAAASGSIIIHRNKDFMPSIDSDGNEHYTDFRKTYKKLSDIQTADGCKTGEFTDYDGISKLVVSSDIPASDWKLYYVMDKSEIYSDVTHIIRVFIIMIPFVVIIFVALYMLISRWKKVMEELKDTAEKAEAASRTKNNFLANMSHEIRTPMNAVVGMTELILREEGISSTVRDYCCQIKNSGKNLLSIINDILDFSKIESGKMEIIEENFNIASSINDISNMSLVRIGDKALEFIAIIDPMIPAELIGDELRLRQITINLITNAIKYSQAGCVVLNIYLEKDENGVPVKPEGKDIYLVVEVTDTGIGIKEKDMEKLFDSFQQVDTKRNRYVEGTGLGLAISKRLIEQMGGTLTVKSTYKKGSVFKFCIPLRAADMKPFLSVKNAESIHAALFTNLSFFVREETRHYKRCNFESLGKALNVDLECYYSFDELKKRMEEKKFTHIIISAADYRANTDFFKDIPELTIVQKRDDVIPDASDVKRIYEPFCSLSFAAALSGKSFFDYSAEDNIKIKFTAPEAKILIVDDNYVNLQVALGLMKPYQMQITTASSGSEAINFLRESMDYDIVFMDHMMPGMDGVETTKLIRGLSDEYFKTVPIIALTANVILEAHDMFTNAGMNGFLAKPIEVASLNNVLRNFLPDSYIQETGAPEQEDTPDEPQVPEGSDEFSPKTGLFYAGDDLDVYHNVLKSYLSCSEENLNNIRSLYEQKDWSNYVIEVHALKSSSLAVGAVTLSELAKELEFAGKNGDTDKIYAKTDELLALYEKVAGIAEKYLSENAVNSAEPEPSAETENVSEEHLREWIERIISACDEMNAAAISDICAEAAGFSFNDKPLKELFDDILAAAEDFEFEEAAEKAQAILS